MGENPEMIAIETLRTLAKLNNLSPWQQEKHYIQSAVLSILADYALVFKGGTYLWFFHGLNRFSEDLDFTQREKIPGNLMEKVSNEMALLGFNQAVKKIRSNKSGNSFRVSVQGPLYTSEKNLCHVYVEISQREKILSDPIPLPFSNPAYLFPAKIVNGMDLQEVVAEKIRAITARNKARDVYDLHYLITQKAIGFDKSFVNKKLSFYKTKFNAVKFSQKVAEKGKIWKKELSQLTRQPLPEFDAVQQAIQDWVK